MTTVLMKKYSNNKLYIPRGNTEPAGYITVKDVIAILRKGKEVKVVDKTTGEDLTIAVLTHALTQIELDYEMLTGLIRIERGTDDIVE